MALTQVQGGMILPSTTLTTPIVATTIGVGGATPSASGSGITFPATQSASSDANCLDDYEEGTWTPTLVPDSGSVTYAARNGNYTKIGNVVTAVFYVRLSAFSGGGNLYIGGLPFACANNYAGMNFSVFNGVNACNLVGLIGNTATSMQLRATNTANVPPQLSASGYCTNNTELAGTITYTTA